MWTMAFDTSKSAKRNERESDSNLTQGGNCLKEVLDKYKLGVAMKEHFQQTAASWRRVNEDERMAEEGQLCGAGEKYTHLMTATTTHSPVRKLSTAADRYKIMGR